MSLPSVAYLLFVVNFLFGVLVATGIVERGRWSRLHHVLYLLTMIGIVAALTDAMLRRQPIVHLAAMALLLLGMTRFRGGSRAHSIYATLCLVAYSALLYKITYGP
jgi:hypothetical protein